MRYALPLLMLLAAPAQAACYADYKAKQDNPLRLHYGVAKVSACDPGSARAELAPRLQRKGWTLLTIIGTFGEDGLKKRKESAGAYFLRF